MDNEQYALLNDGCHWQIKIDRDRTPVMAVVAELEYGDYTGIGSNSATISRPNCSSIPADCFLKQLKSIELLYLWLHFHSGFYFNVLKDTVNSYQFHHNDANIMTHCIIIPDAIYQSN